MSPRVCCGCLQIQADDAALATKFGLPLDSSSLTQTNAGEKLRLECLFVTDIVLAWTLFAAATVTDSSVRDSLIGTVWNHANASSFFPLVYKLDSTSSTVSGASR